MSRKYIEGLVEFTIFASRWIQAPIYLGLVFGAVLYCAEFIMQVGHMFTRMASATE